MKVNILDAHDRLLQFKKQSDYISKGCQDCIKSRPEEFGNYPFYIFSHKREIGVDERISIFNHDIYHSYKSPVYLRKYGKLEDVPTHRLIWSPRLTKPKAQTNSMLFKYFPSLDQIKVIWILPQKELWDQYFKDNLTENEIVCQSINDFRNNIGKLEKDEDDDLNEEQCKQIYMQISCNASSKKLMGRLYEF